MKPYQNPTILFAVLLLLMSTSVAQSPPEAPFKVGEVFPNLVLPALRDGRPTSLAQFRGKKVILHVFASW